MLHCSSKHLGLKNQGENAPSQGSTSASYQ